MKGMAARVIVTQRGAGLVTGAGPPARLLGFGSDRDGDAQLSRRLCLYPEHVSTRRKLAEDDRGLPAHRLRPDQLLAVVADRAEGYRSHAAGPSGNGPDLDPDPCTRPGVECHLDRIATVLDRHLHTLAESRGARAAGAPRRAGQHGHRHED